MLIVWVKFIICVLAILYAGARITKYADVIAEKAGLTRAWIGLVLLATITSLPELANGISAVTLVDAPDLAVGNIFGACLFNMFTIVLLDFLYNLPRGREPIFCKISSGHLFPASLGMILIGLAALGVILGRIVSISFLNIGLFTFLIAIFYLIAQRLIYVYEKQRGEIGAIQYEHIEAKETYIKFIFFAAIVIAAGTWLPHIGAEMALVMGWGRTFVGSFFLGLATTLPELVVSISAFRLGVIDMSIGNLFGSNIFNLGILFVDDVFYRKAILFQNISINHAFTLSFLVIMTSMAIAGIVFKSDKKVFGRLSYPSLIMFIVFLLGFYVLYSLGVRI